MRHRTPKVDPNVALVSTRTFEDHSLRAIVVLWPGGAPDLYLQRIDNGDEGEPFRVVREVKVEHSAVNTIDAVTWGDESLYFVEDSGGKTREWYVRATSDELGAKAQRR